MLICSLDLGRRPSASPGLAVVVRVVGHIRFRVSRGLFEPSFVDRNNIAVRRGVVLEHTPRQGISAGSYAMKAAEFEHGVADEMTSLVGVTESFMANLLEIRKRFGVATAGGGGRRFHQQVPIGSDPEAKRQFRYQVGFGEAFGSAAQP